MIVFDVRQSPECKKTVLKRRKKAYRIGSIAYLPFVITFFLLYFFNTGDSDRFAFLILGVMFFLAWLLFLIAPNFVFYPERLPGEVVFDDGYLYITTGDTHSRYSFNYIAKIVDCGGWYDLYCSFPRVTVFCTCDKSKLKSGTLEEFERLFEDILHTEGESEAEEDECEENL